MAQSTLADIRAKVRKLTGRPSTTQITDADIDNYVNSYYVYELPNSLKLAKLQDVYTFETTANVDTYDFDLESYYVCKPPVYCAGYQVDFYQNNELFYRTYPKNNFIEEVATGDGGAGPYTGTLTNTPFLRSIKTSGYSSLSSENLGVRGAGDTSIAQLLSSTPIRPGTIVITDGTTIFTDDGVGGFTITGGTGTVNSPTVYSNGFLDITFTTANPGATITVDYYVINKNISAIQNILFTGNTATGSSVAEDDGIGGFLAPAAGTIDYSDGTFSVTFPAAIPAGEEIWAQYFPYVASRPRSILYFQNQFVVRPVPDISYKIEINVMRSPTDLLAAGDEPEINDLWELLAFGAASKILVDNGDFEVLGAIRPFLEEQFKFAQRRTIAAGSSKRSATIYTQDNTYQFNSNYPNI